MLLDYRGTLLMVSHDRAFLNNMVTSTLVMDGAGVVREYVGGYDDWLRQSQAEAISRDEDTPRKACAPALQTRSQPTTDGPRKLNYKEQRALVAQKLELSDLPLRIEAMEAEQKLLTTAMSSQVFYQQDSTEIARAVNRLKELEDELALSYQRWEELEQ